MGIILVIAIFTMFVAVTKSQGKSHTLLFILSWTLAVSTAGGLVAFFVSTLIGIGNPSAVAGDIAGPALTFTLLLSSANRIIAHKRMQRAVCK